MGAGARYELDSDPFLFSDPIQVKTHGQVVIKKLESGEDVFALLRRDASKRVSEDDALSNNNNLEPRHTTSLEIEVSTSVADENLSVEALSNAPSKTKIVSDAISGLLRLSRKVA